MARKKNNQEFTPQDLSELTRKGARQVGKEISYGEFGEARDAEVLDKTRRRKRLLFWLTLLLIAFLFVLWILMFWWTRAGDLVIDVDRFSEQKGIILCETSDFKHPESVLSSEGIKDVTNITYAWLTDDLTIDGAVDYLDNYKNPKDDAVDGGTHNGDKANGRESKKGAKTAGENYLAYTFYCKNAGTEKVDYKATLINNGAAKSMDEAVRVMVFKNGTPTIYAQSKHNSKDPEDDSSFLPKSIAQKPWINKQKIMTTETKDFKAGDVDKYTIVMWVEGNDPECINDIMGGHMKMSMTFEVQQDEEV